MKLFWCPQTRSARALWMMEEAGVPYERVKIDIRDRSAPRDPEFALASPMGKVPALADGEARFADSAAICIYVADKYPQAKLAPPIDDPKRGAYLWWMTFTPGVIEPAMTEKFTGGKPDRFRSGWGDFELMIETIEKGLGDGPWLLGEDFSAADVMVGSSVNFMKQFGMLPDNQALLAYVERCLARPAYGRALEIDSRG
jgi:glutathione S-transferase